VINADAAELVALLMVDPKHACSSLCFCNRLREIPDIAEALRRLEIYSDFGIEVGPGTRRVNPETINGNDSRKN